MDPGFRREAGFSGNSQRVLNHEAEEHAQRGPGAMSRRLWLLALCIYGAAAAIDIAAHLRADVRAGQSWHDSANLAVAFSAGLFWPADLIAALLLPR